MKALILQTSSTVVAGQRVLFMAPDTCEAERVAETMRAQGHETEVSGTHVRVWR